MYYNRYGRDGYFEFAARCQGCRLGTLQWLVNGEVIHYYSNDNIRLLSRELELPLSYTCMNVHHITTFAP